MNEITTGVVLDIPLEQIRPFAGQPRRYFNPDGLRKLANSIATRGQETPGSVRRLGPDEQQKGHLYELIDGERRFRACALGKLPTFRAIICGVTDTEDQFERSVVSNFGREGHPPMEIAAAVKRLRERYTIEETAERLAKSAGWVCMYQSLLNLDERVQAMLDPSLPEDKQLRFVIATRLSQIPDRKFQVQAAQHIVARRLNLRAAELYIRQSAAEKGAEFGKPKASTQGRTIERFIERLTIDSEMVLEARQIDFQQALGGKTFTQLRRLLEQMDACMENVTGIRDAVRAVYEGRDLKARQVAMQRTA